MDTLPPELLLYIFSFLPLTSLISACGVNARWRALVQNAPLHHARKFLLDLYLAAVTHPKFPSLVTELQTSLDDFDREAYIAHLRSRGCVLPDVFVLWILEWPSKAIYFRAWPGLTQHHYAYGFLGVNFLGRSERIIGTIPVPKAEVDHVGKKACKGIPLWGVQSRGAPRNWVSLLWLVVDANERISDKRAGRLLWTRLTLKNGTALYAHMIHDTPFVADTLIQFLDLPK